MILLPLPGLLLKQVPPALHEAMGISQGFMPSEVHFHTYREALFGGVFVAVVVLIWSPITQASLQIFLTV